MKIGLDKLNFKKRKATLRGGTCPLCLYDREVLYPHTVTACKKCFDSKDLKQFVKATPSNMRLGNCDICYRFRQLCVQFNAGICDKCVKNRVKHWKNKRKRDEEHKKKIEKKRRVYG